MSKRSFTSTCTVAIVCNVLKVLAGILALFVLSSCGGGGGGSGTAVPPPIATCSVEAQRDWLRSYMLDWYLWSGASPDPAPQGYATLPSYFAALFYLGDVNVGGVVPADKWSYITDSASYTQFFTEGKTLGYGLFVNGIELQLPLKARFIEAQSPAAIQDLVRSDEIVTVNARTAADLMASNDFSALSLANECDAVTLVVRNSSGTRSVTLTAAVYNLTPVPVTQVLTLPNASKVGYLVMKDFITQAEAPLTAAFNSFRAAGARDVILDLRYNGGGRISTATVLASLVAGITHDQSVFTNLIFNT